ncbi:MAG: tRNA pseudouridine(38-40) synthase TruA [Clostridia bacterium]|nr:tRNA pseudouridine(38-40) synthase TruA [Clostridia bacterium]
MARYAMIIEYDGTEYAGWQRQKNAVSVQQKIEEALEIVLGVKTIIYASGRTDAGVHAEGQVAHFDAEKELNPRSVAYSLNSLLPSDVKIQKIIKVAPDFHAQYSAKRKTYTYRSYVSDCPSPLKDRFYARILPPVDVEKMKRASKCLVGKHDFKAFCSTGSSIKSTEREIYEFNVIEKGDEVIFEITGNGFLYNMVRIIVGTLYFIGKGKLPETAIEEMLRTGNRRAGGKTYPACGLSLKKVEYVDAE